MTLADKLALVTFLLNFVGFVGGGLFFLFKAGQAFSSLKELAGEALRQGVAAHERLDKVYGPKLEHTIIKLERLDEKVEMHVQGHQAGERHGKGGDA